jgi:hypothetical protein
MQPTPADPYQPYSYGYAPAAPDRLMAHSTFVVDQKAKLIELRNEYSSQRFASAGAHGDH